MRELHTDQFRWLAKDRIFSAGTLDVGPAEFWLQRMHLNTMQEGIALRSHRTGDVKRLRLIYRDMNRGWCRAWVFQGSAKGRLFHVLIYNDVCQVDEHVLVQPEYDE